MFLFISILLLFINYFTVQRELEELRKYLGSGGERGEKVDEGDNWTIGQVGHKIPTTGQTVHEGDKREPDVKPSSLLNSTDPGYAAADLEVVNASSVYQQNYNKWGPEQALTEKKLEKNEQTPVGTWCGYQENTIRSYSIIKYERLTISASNLGMGLDANTG